MPLSLRIPSDKERMIKRAASRAGKTKTAFILEAVDEKLCLAKTREEIIREMSGWLSRKEAEQLRKTVDVLGKVDEEDWH